MLMKDDKKKSVSLIMGKLMGKPEEAPSEAGAEQDDSMALETAADELIKALESKSPKQVADAFKAMMDLCDDDSQYEEKAESEPEQP